MTCTLALMGTLLATMLGCTKDDGSVDETDTTGGDDTGVVDDTGEEVEVVHGESVVFHNGTKFVAFENVNYALSETAMDTQELGGGSSWTALADFDGDARDDIWQLPDGGDKASVFINDGEGVWTTVADFNPDTNVGTKRPVVAGDFDGDGKDDIGLFNTTGGRFLVYPLVVASFSVDDKVGTATSLGEVGSFVAADMNGDGYDDIVQLAGSDVRIYRVVDKVLVDVEVPWWEGRIQGAVHAFGIDLNDDGQDELATWSGTTLTVYGVGEIGPDLESSVQFKLSSSGTPHAARIR
jgi:hypothetical protein